MAGALCGLSLCLYQPLLIAFFANFMAIGGSNSRAIVFIKKPVDFLVL